MSHCYKGWNWINTKSWNCIAIGWIPPSHILENSLITDFVFHLPAHTLTPTLSLSTLYMLSLTHYMSSPHTRDRPHLLRKASLIPKVRVERKSSLPLPHSLPFFLHHQPRKTPYKNPKNQRRSKEEKNQK